MDVVAERLVRALPTAVARVMFDPANDPRWIGGAKSVEPWGGAIAVGVRVRRHGGFLGRTFSWVTQVTTLEPDHRLAMDIVEGPMSGAVTYTIEPAPGGSRVAIRNAGQSSFSVPGMAWMLRKSVEGDLKRLAALVEA